VGGEENYVRRGFMIESGKVDLAEYEIDTLKLSRPT